MQKRNGTLYWVVTALIALLGISVLFYPAASDLWNHWRDLRLMTEYDRSTLALTDEDCSEILRLIATLLRTGERDPARSLTVYVGLSRDSAQNETLTIFFPADEGQVADIGNDNYVSISLQTANYTRQFTNATFVNTCYLTPSENQPFDTTAVSRGNYTQLNEKDSVVSDAAVDVAYGYATSSIKSVTELDDRLHETENTAKSTDSITRTRMIRPGRLPAAISSRSANRIMRSQRPAASKAPDSEKTPRIPSRSPIRCRCPSPP